MPSSSPPGCRCRWRWYVNRCSVCWLWRRLDVLHIDREFRGTPRGASTHDPAPTLVARELVSFVFEPAIIHQSASVPFMNPPHLLLLLLFLIIIIVIMPTPFSTCLRSPLAPLGEYNVLNHKYRDQRKHLLPQQVPKCRPGQLDGLASRSHYNFDIVVLHI